MPDATPEITKELARDQITTQIERFLALPKRTRDDYSEDDVSRLLLRLFDSMGWDTLNPAEVSGQETISGKRADYGFYLGGQPVFYLEVKETRANLDDPRWIRQAISYAWQRGTTWAVLSNFQRIRTFVAEELPKKGEEEQTRFLPDFTIDQYIERFDDLWLLSRPAMQERLLDKEAERVGKKARSRSVNTVEKQLSSQFIDWRDTFQNLLTKWNNEELFESIDSAVQRLLDRMIFLKTMEDRNVETGRKLIEIARYAGKGDLFEMLKTQFREMDDIYDSNLFRESRIDQLTLPDPTPVRKFIESFYEVPQSQDRYNFAAISVDVLGRVYEDYLGDTQATREDRKAESQQRTQAQSRAAATQRKRGKRKGQGIYYTPQFVVRYILQQTLGHLLEQGRDPHRIRVLDPACGSGGFLIAAFDLLDRWLEKHEPNTPKAIRRRRIITENLYGVDLDEQAVEITRLNLVLRASEERTTLPLLDTTIRRGNSLVDDPDIAGTLAFKWNHQFESVMQSGGFDVVVGNPPYVRQETLGEQFKTYAQANYETFAGTADLYTYFIEKGIKLLRPGGLYGVIVANKWMRAAYGEPLRRWLKQQPLHEIVDFGDLPVFEEATTYPCILIAGSSQESDSDDVQIAQVKTLDFDSLENHLYSRRFSLSRAALDDSGWSLAGGETETLLAKLRAAGVPLKDYINGKIYYGIKTGLNEAFVIDEATRARLVTQDPHSADLIKPFLAGRDVKRYIAADTGKYLILIPNGWTRQQLVTESASPETAWAWLKAHYPAISTHLAPYEERAIRRTDQGEFWWELRPCDYYNKFEKPKIVFPDISPKGNFLFDSVGSYYSANTTYFFNTDEKYLLGLLNSKVIYFVCAKTFSTYQGGYLRFFTQYVAELPIRRINFDDPADRASHDQMVALIDRMLALKREHAAAVDALRDDRDDLKAQIDKLDNEIDALVYELYGLTEDEIALVEGGG